MKVGWGLYERTHPALNLGLAALVSMGLTVAHWPEMRRYGRLSGEG